MILLYFKSKFYFAVSSFSSFHPVFTLLAPALMAQHDFCDSTYLLPTSCCYIILAILLFKCCACWLVLRFVTNLARSQPPLFFHPDSSIKYISSFTSCMMFVCPWLGCE